MKLKLIDRVVECLERRDCDRHRLGSKPTHVIFFCFWERHFTALSLLGGLGKQFQILVISLLNFKRTAISWHL